jgi:hypothetical protein
MATIIIPPFLSIFRFLGRPRLLTRMYSLPGSRTCKVRDRIADHVTQIDRLLLRLGRTPCCLPWPQRALQGGTCSDAVTHAPVGECC